MTIETAGALFRPGGPIARAFAHYEERPQQAIMADAVAAAFQTPHHLVVEAGTGVGKSFAYLVPAIRFAVDQNKPVVISTRTLTLQDQLIKRDIPALAGALGIEFKARVLKGRGNYLCLRRMDFTCEHRSSSFTTRAEEEEFDLIRRWMDEIPSGTRDELPFLPENAVWGLVASEASACRGRACDHFENCWYYRAKARLAEAQIIIVNHSLYFSDLALGTRAGPHGLLPAHGHVVLDEAHTVEEVAAAHIGTRVSNYQLNHLLRGLYHGEKERGFLVDFGTDASREACRSALAATEAFYGGVRDLAAARTAGRETVWTVEPDDTVPDTISSALDNLADQLSDAIAEFDPEETATRDVAAEYDLRYARLTELSGGIKAFLARAPGEGFVYWAEHSGGQRGQVVSVNMVPLDVSGFLRESLFGARQSVVMTGASLSVNNEDDFAYFRRKVGLETGICLKLDSPFDFTNRVRLMLARTLPSPQADDFRHRAGQVLRDLLPSMEGGVLLLFTSHESMHAFADDLTPMVAALGRKALVQGEGVGRTLLLEAFQDAGNAVLFATSSFWMGVDVPGPALSHVIIMRLPFAVPNHPVVRGKCRLIEARGGNAFMEYSLPEAILTFKQGVGRLLRTSEDRGTVAVFDSRIIKARYGRHFLAALPPCRPEYF
ncbi:MAG: helicase C-terminal domain-containing protein [Planctomycetota bacterium]